MGEARGFDGSVNISITICPIKNNFLVFFLKYFVPSIYFFNEKY